MKAPITTESLPTIAIHVTVPGLLRGDILPTRYTCDGKNISPPVRWTEVPGDTAELAVFIVSFQPVHGSLIIDYAVTGLNPKLSGISPGQLPLGAVVGRNSFGKDGYTICPDNGRFEHYAVKVIALSHRLNAHPDTDGLALYQEAERSAKVIGIAGVAYKRP